MSNLHDGSASPFLMDFLKIMNVIYLEFVLILASLINKRISYKKCVFLLEDC